MKGNPRGIFDNVKKEARSSAKRKTKDTMMTMTTDTKVLRKEIDDRLKKLVDRNYEI